MIFIEFYMKIYKIFSGVRELPRPIGESRR